MKVEIAFSDREYELLDAVSKAEDKTIQDFIHEAAISSLAGALCSLGSQLEKDFSLLSDEAERSETS